MLDVKRALTSAPKEHEKGEAAVLLTPWGATLDAERVLQEHPRPQFARDRFAVLNGWWDYAIVPHACARDGWREACAPETFDGRILVPFTPETALSSVGRSVSPDELLWYRRSAAVPEMPSGWRCLLRFQAVDWACACYVNGVRVGEHVGGYLPFAFDITDAIGESGASFEISLCVFDPSDAGTQLRGKQKIGGTGIWYEAQTGIWQTVWLEIVPEDRIEALRVDADMRGFLTASVDVSDAGCHDLALRVLDAEGVEVACATVSTPCSCEPDGATVEGGCELAGPTTLSVALKVDDAHVWDVDDPYLYDIEVTYGQDVVRSYCGFRSVSVEGNEHGFARFCLNGKPLLLKGVLDQGYWSDGLMTAPADEALIFDIEAMKDLGFNMLRKHIKVEADRWYYHCDRLGMLVWQDMVSGGSAYGAWQTSYKPTALRWSWSHFDDSTPKQYAKLSAGDEAYRREWEETCVGTIEHLRNHPSVVGWTLFNEAWGQFEARRITKRVRALDSRPLDSVSGWYDQRCGDFLSVHNYFRGLEVWRDHAKPEDVRDAVNRSGRRAFSLSEFGGFSYLAEGHNMYEGSYGYAGFESLDAWRAAVLENLARAEQLEGEGLSVFVYTQLSDVEEEINGLLTMDRRVNKLSGEGAAR